MFQDKAFRNYFFLSVGIYSFLLVFSWLAFFNASNDPATIYQPLRSFLLPVPFAEDMPNWLLAIKGFKPESALKLINEAFTWVFALSQIGLFIYAYKKKFSFDQIQFASIYIVIMAVFLIPADSSDLYGYIARGAQQVFEGQNPYAETVAMIDGWQSNPYFANTLWENNPAPYGPMFMILCKLLVQFSFGNFWLCLLLFKLFNAAVFILFGFFLREQMEEKQFLIYALNPLIIVQCIWNCHNDLLMGVLVFLGIFYATRKEFNLSFLVIVWSALIKYVSVVLLPFIALYAMFDPKKAFKLRIFNFPLYGLLIAGTFVQFFVYHFMAHTKFESGEFKGNLLLSHKSLFDVFNSLHRYAFNADLPNYFKYIFLGAFALICLSFVIQIFKKKEKLDKSDFLKYSFWVLFILISVIASKFHSWYIIMYVILGIFVHPVLMLLLSSSHMLSLTFLDQANIANFLLMTLIPVIFYFSKKSSSL